MNHAPKIGVKTSAIISLWNYGEFVNECLEGALKQTLQLDEIIVVDDGSTDDGPNLVEKMAAKEPKIRLIKQANQGQLAAFQAGFEASCGEILFFLDADDIWEKDHVEKFCQVFKDQPKVDFVFTGYQEFGRSTQRVRPYSQDMFLGQSILSTRFNRNYIGSITSTNAIRRHLVERIFPVPADRMEQGRINADAYLVFGSSLAGGTKYYLNDLTVKYRIHEKNNYQGRRYSNIERFEQVTEQWQTIEYLWDRLELPDSLCTEIAREFNTIPRPDRRCYKRAIQTLSKLPLSLAYWLRCRIELFRHYYKARNGS